MQVFVGTFRGRGFVPVSNQAVPQISVPRKPRSKALRSSTRLEALTSSNELVELRPQAAAKGTGLLQKLEHVDMSSNTTTSESQTEAEMNSEQLICLGHAKLLDPFLLCAEPAIELLIEDSESDDSRTVTDIASDDDQVSGDNQANEGILPKSEPERCVADSILL